MERVIYDRMAEHDSRHWWYIARRDILAAVIAREILLPPQARILEIGCGTGHNLSMLARFGDIEAIEIDEAARAIAARRIDRAVHAAPLPALDGIAHGQYDLIAILDVLEHVEQDEEALRQIAARLRPGGCILITVPAFPWLWSAHDVTNHHHRRYTRKSLKRVIRAAGLRLRTLSWFNSALFPLVVCARFWGKITGKEDSDDALPSPLINKVLEKIFGFERHLVGRVPMPPGVSLIAIVSA